mmetsp:Transcript_12623/g.17426  ORF Transcript_12623/g.17426 Transcript_12623/m.17426 type:complete len:221 (-) Transcript_12623:45-707(-)
MVTPNDNVVNVLNSSTSSFGNLANGSALIESGQGVEVSLGDGRSVVGSDKGVGVSGVSDNENLDALLGNLIEGSTLSLENLGICTKEILAFHTRATGSSTDENSSITVLETNHWVSGRNDLVNKRISTIHELHAQTLERTFSLRKFNELQNDLSDGSEHASLSNEVAEERSNLASGTSNGNTNWGIFEVLGYSREVTTVHLKSVYENRVIHPESYVCSKK